MLNFLDGPQVMIGNHWLCCNLTRYREKLKNNPERLGLYLQKDKERKKKARDLEKLVEKSAEQIAHDREVARLRQQRRRRRLKVKAQMESQGYMVCIY